jgi:hypothetical protein
LDAIADGLERVKETLLNEVYDTFLGFEEAWDWLEMQIDRGKLTPRDPETATGYSDQRENCLDEYVRRACLGDRYGGAVHDFNDPMDEVDSDDSDYEWQKNIRRPDLVNEVKRWVVMLLEWRDREAAKRVWDDVKESNATGSSYFAVDG